MGIDPYTERALVRMQHDSKEKREAWKRATFGFHYGSRGIDWCYSAPASVHKEPQPEMFAGHEYTYRCVRERREFTELDKCKVCPKCGGPVNLVKKR